MKLRTLLSTGVIAIFALFAAGCGDSPSEADIDAELEAIFDEALAELEAEFEADLPENANTQLETSATFEVEGLSHTVNHVLDNWANPEDVFGFETGDEGFKLVAVNLTVTNTGDADSEASQLYYTLDFGGEENAEHSFYGSTATNITRFESTDLATGESYTGDFLFEVPVDSTPADWTLVYNSDPFEFQDGYEPTRVPLQ